ncbi:hypothetical protein CDAR_428281 [Caerostris darwini]|uniref:Uncharacterized protein n=1 Tax=Caerostris darwini TaxID=1538125 RepID=A0AAV4PC05_9ARAC|nr:hypothetical protein CDAR_428281 [Caerostris darwini]
MAQLNFLIPVGPQDPEFGDKSPSTYRINRTQTWDRKGHMILPVCLSTFPEPYQPLILWQRRPWSSSFYPRIKINDSRVKHAISRWLVWCSDAVSLFLGLILVHFLQRNRTRSLVIYDLQSL